MSGTPPAPLRWFRVPDDAVRVSSNVIYGGLLIECAPELKNVQLLIVITVTQHSLKILSSVQLVDCQRASRLARSRSRTCCAAGSVAARCIACKLVLSVDWESHPAALRDSPPGFSQCPGLYSVQPATPLPTLWPTTAVLGRPPLLAAQQLLSA